MKYIILADGTRINGCTDSTTSNEIYISRESFEKAGIEADKINENNTTSISVYDSETDELINSGADMKFISISIKKVNEEIIVVIITRFKTELEIIHDEIAELQETLIGE